MTGTGAAALAAAGTALLAAAALWVRRVRADADGWRHSTRTAADPRRCRDRCRCNEDTWPRGLRSLAGTSTGDPPAIHVLDDAGRDDEPAAPPPPTMGPADDDTAAAPRPPGPVGRRYVQHPRRPPAGRPRGTAPPT